MRQRTARRRAPVNVNDFPQRCGDSNADRSARRGASGLSLLTPPRSNAVRPGAGQRHRWRARAPDRPRRSSLDAGSGSTRTARGADARGAFRSGVDKEIEAVAERRPVDSRSSPRDVGALGQASAPRLRRPSLGCSAQRDGASVEPVQTAATIRRSFAAARRATPVYPGRSPANEATFMRNRRRVDDR